MLGYAPFMVLVLGFPLIGAFAAEVRFRRQRVVTALAIAAVPTLIYLVSLMIAARSPSIDLGLLELAGYAYALSLVGALIGTGLGMLVGWAYRRLRRLRS